MSGLRKQNFNDRVKNQRDAEGAGMPAPGFSLDADTTLVFNRDSRRISLSKKTLLPEDELAFRFAKILDEAGIRYVVVAGYVAILFGRARRSEDIDFMVEWINEDGFVELCKIASRQGFSLIQGDIRSEDSARRVYRSRLAEGFSVRFMYEDIIVPNIEFRMVGSSVDRYALEHSLTVEVSNRFIIKVSPLEQQIAYKLYLGSEKDVGDAVFLYTLFRDVIDHGELEKWCRELGADCSILEGV